MDRQEVLSRISEALRAAAEALSTLPSSGPRIEQKATGGLVTDADRLINEVLRKMLPQGAESWLSEESADNLDRLGRRWVWIVDPLDGTQEFVAGIPEWCISVALVEDRRAVAGGIYNPVTRQLFLGSVGAGLTLNGQPVGVRACSGLDVAEVLASRSEVQRGEWDRLSGRFKIRPMGSVAYKLALVASGLADATWTLVPKHEWDVAAGVALVLAGGGVVRTLSWQEPTFNNRVPRFDGLVATGSGLQDSVQAFLAEGLQHGSDRFLRVRVNEDAEPF